MTDLALEPSRVHRKNIAWSDRQILLACLGTLALLHLATALLRGINWDEFYFLAQIHDYQNARLGFALQAFHVHLLGWLTALPFQDIGQIIAARMVMLAAHLGTVFFIYRISETLVSRDGALISAVAYSGFLFVLQHATSFRTDGLITVLPMGSIFLLICRPCSFANLTMAMLATALAGLISVKSVFFLPAILMICGVKFAECQNKAGFVWRFMASGLVAALFFVLAFLWHSSTVSHGIDQTGTQMGGILTKVLAEAGIFYGIQHFKLSLLTGLFLWGLFAGGLVLVLGRLRSEFAPDRQKAIMMLALATPLLSLIFYRNTYPYFYVVIMAPAAIVASLAADWLVRTIGNKAKLAAFLIVIAAIGVIRQADGTMADQRSLLRGIHLMFPNPVAYIDRNSMIIGFPKSGFFMSKWGVENYREAGEPLLAKAIDTEAPVFVLANHPSLLSVLSPGAPLPLEAYRLLPEDQKALAENYVPHWGLVYVAGKTLPASVAELSAFEIKIEGPYTIESSSSVSIDGQRYAPGSVVMLSEGSHMFMGPAATLRHGDHLPKPDWVPPLDAFGDGN